MSEKSISISQSGAYTVVGTVRDQSGAGISGLRVVAFDHDFLLKDDDLGRAVTNSAGVFTISFSKKDFKELFFDKKPDLYFEVFQPDGSHIHSTKSSPIRNADESTGPIILTVNLESVIIGHDSIWEKVKNTVASLDETLLIVVGEDHTYLLYTDNLEAAKDEIAAAGGFVNLQMSDRSIVGQFPADFDVSSLKHSTRTIYKSGDEAETVATYAWHIMHEKDERRKAGNLEEKDNISWDDGAHQPPDLPGHIHEDQGAVQDSTRSMSGSVPVPGVNNILQGKVTVGLVIVSGNTAETTFSAFETAKVVAEVAEATNWLTQQNRDAALNYLIVPKYISIPNGNAGLPSGSSCTAYENVWLNPTLPLLGVRNATGRAGANQYAVNIRAANSAMNGWSAFFIKFEACHFAYQTGQGTYMQYSNDGWGPDLINRVFAHESGHVFGAPDEYASSGCGCGNRGFFSVPNNNCDNCTSPYSKTACLMKANTLSICQWSRGSLGWSYYYQVPDNSTSAGPAAVEFNGRLYLAFKANDSSNQIYVMSSANGTTWDASAPVPGNSTSADPTLAVFNNRLYLAFKANDSSNQIFVMSSSDGSTWGSSAAIPNNSTSAAPSLATFGSRLYVVFKANDSSNKIYVISSSDGSSWNTSYAIPSNSTSDGPGAIAFNGRLYVVFKANDNSNQIYVISSADGSTWNTSYAIPSNSTSAGPRVTVFYDRLFVFFKANDSSNQIYFISSADGSTWNASKAIPNQSTRASAAATVFNNKLLSIYKANDSSNTLYVTYLNRLSLTS